MVKKKPFVGKTPFIEIATNSLGIVLTLHNVGNLDYNGGDELNDDACDRILLFRLFLAIDKLLDKVEGIDSIILNTEQIIIMAGLVGQCWIC